MAYISDPEASEEPFDVSNIPRISREQAAKDAASEPSSRHVEVLPVTDPCAGPTSLETIGAPSTSKAPTPPPPTVADTQSAYASQLADVPEFASYGPVLHSSIKPTQLTESETEYQASSVKHIFKEHIVFQVSFAASLNST